MSKTVVVVEDDAGLREQLVKILGTASDLKCVAAFASGE
jgi:DNA-binding NarL/FixJ family response regulator